MTTLDHPVLRDVPGPADADDVSVSAADLHEFEEFVRRHTRWARGQLRRLLRNEDDIEDAWQEVCLRLWKAWPPTSSPRGLLATVLPHVAIDIARSKESAQARLTESLGHDDPPAAACDPLDHVVRTEQRDAVRQALRELPPDQRALVFARHHCETPFAVLASEGGTTSGALRNKEGRVLRKLRTRLTDVRAGVPAPLLRVDMRVRESWWQTEDAVARVVPGSMSTAITSFVLTTLVVIPSAQRPLSATEPANPVARPRPTITEPAALIAGPATGDTAGTPAASGSAGHAPGTPPGPPIPVSTPAPTLPVQPPDPGGGPCVGAACSQNIDVVTVTVPVTGDQQQVGQGWVPACAAWPAPPPSSATCHTEGHPNYIVQPDEPSSTPPPQPAEG
jgi:RNA polymerase sigma factor (sigma-70 family)